MYSAVTCRFHPVFWSLFTQCMWLWSFHVRCCPLPYCVDVLACIRSLVRILGNRFPCFAIADKSAALSPVRPQVHVFGGLQDIYQGGELASCRAYMPPDRQDMSRYFPKWLYQLCFCQQRRAPVALILASLWCYQTSKLFKNLLLAEGAKVCSIFIVSP